MTQPTADFWSSLGREDDPLEQLLDALLHRLLQSRSIDADQAARLCLTPQELAGLLPAEVKSAHAQHTAESLAWFLEEQGDGLSLAGAIRDWKVSIELARSRFGWLELPPAIRKKAHLKAGQLLAAAEGRGWIEAQDGQWHLTEQGRIVAEQRMG